MRGHWGIENHVHWVLDMVFDEDYSRMRERQTSPGRDDWHSTCYDRIKRESSASDVSASKLNRTMTTSHPY